MGEREGESNGSLTPMFTRVVWQWVSDAWWSTRAPAWGSPPSRHHRTTDPAGFASSLFLVEFALLPPLRSRAAQIRYSTLGAVAELSGPGGVEQMELSPDVTHQEVDRKRQTTWG